MRAVWLTALGCLLCLGSGCEESPSPPSGSEAPRGGERRAPEGCPDTDGPFVRGRVLAPRFDLAGDDAGSPDAGAWRPERREFPARAVAVTVVSTDDGEAIGRTETDAKGRWCIDTGDREPGMEMLARAAVDGTEFRRPLLTREGQVISVRSEAVWRLIGRAVDEPATVPAATFLNLEVLVSTATDLLEPVDWRRVETVGEAVERTVETSRHDPRVSARLERLGGR